MRLSIFDPNQRSKPIYHPKGLSLDLPRPFSIPSTGLIHNIPHDGRRSLWKTRLERKPPCRPDQRRTPNVQIRRNRARSCDVVLREFEDA